MPKMIAPHGASWRGRALVAGECIDVSDQEASHLTAHGFRLVEKGAFSTVQQGSTGTADILSAAVLTERPDAGGPAFAEASAGQEASPPKLRSSVGGAPAVPVEPSIPARPASDVDTLSRKDLLKRLKGRGLGNLFVKTTDELRALAANVAANPKIAEAHHGDE